MNKSLAQLDGHVWLNQWMLGIYVVPTKPCIASTICIKHQCLSFLYNGSMGFNVPTDETVVSETPSYQIPIWCRYSLYSRF